MTDTVEQTDTLPSEDDVRQALKSVYDPEIGISIVDLGLVYGVQVDDDSKNVLIDMTLTTPACPLPLKGEPLAVTAPPGVAGLSGPHVFVGAPGCPGVLGGLAKAVPATPTLSPSTPAARAMLRRDDFNSRSLFMRPPI